MEPSDFLTILGLGLAVWAIIPAKERRFILLFFSKLEIGILITLLIVVHFLMAFEWLMSNWFSWLYVFTFEGGIPSDTWAYIFALFIFVYPIIKVSFGYYSSNRINETILLYESYLKENEIDLLVTFINKYHTLDIKKYLQSLSKFTPKDPIDIVLRRRTEADLAYEKLIKTKRTKFAAWVYSHIIENEIFIQKASNKYPDLFATIISGMETKKVANEWLVKLFIENLFESKNHQFIQELQVMDGTGSSVLEMNEQAEIPILYSLLANTKVASENYVWYPVGEGTVKALKHDKNQEEFLLKKFDDDLKHELWNLKIHIAIVYFNYMVRETIYRNSGWHMWLFYFKNFTKLLVEIIPIQNDYKSDSEYPSFAHRMIYDQFYAMNGWLDLAKELDTDNRVIDTVRCLGGCVHIICQACDSKISIEFRRRQLDMVLSTYFEFSHYPDNIGAKTAREWLEKMFLNPKGVDYGTAEITEEYLAALQDAWDEFDKVPYKYHEDNGSIQRFVTKIIEPLGLNE